MANGLLSSPPPSVRGRGDESFPLERLSLADVKEPVYSEVAEREDDCAGAEPNLGVTKFPHPARKPRPCSSLYKTQRWISTKQPPPFEQNAPEEKGLIEKV